MNRDAVKLKLLLHICCAPDATAVIERLGSQYNITGYFYNPNIHPEGEYYLRLEEMKTLAQRMNFKLLWGEYDTDRWFSLTQGLEHEPEGGARCEVCFRMRLEKTAQLAKENGFNRYTTVLTISPHKNAEVIHRVGKEVSQRLGVPFLAADFKKKDGFKRSVELSREFGLYRQNYCGCLYSRREQNQQARQNENRRHLYRTD